jgi:hypothetical protein
MNTKERERKKDICIHMRNKGKEGVCTFDPYRGIEEEEWKRRWRK